MSAKLQSLLKMYKETGRQVEVTVKHQKGDGFKWATVDYFDEDLLVIQFCHNGRFLVVPIAEISHIYVVCRDEKVEDKDQVVDMPDGLKRMIVEKLCR